MRHANGFTLIEIIITIVVISIASTSLLSAFNAITRNSADPALIQQSVAIAQAYMEEITLQPYNDPDGLDNEGTNRPLYDDVDDYNGLPDTTVKDRSGNPVSNLSAFSVSVAVTTTTLNGLTAKQISVTASHPAIPSYQLIGYRTNY